jgi:transposase-like protein
VPRSYAPEFRRRVVGLVRSGRPVAESAADVGVSEATVYRWMAEGRMDHREQPMRLCTVAFYSRCGGPGVLGHDFV